MASEPIPVITALNQLQGSLDALVAGYELNDIIYFIINIDADPDGPTSVMSLRKDLDISLPML
jgi:hypothetical protein